MPKRTACLLSILLAAACTSTDRSLDGQGNALATRIDKVAEPLRGGVVVESVRHDLLSMRDRTKSLAATEVARIPKASSDVKRGLASVGQDFEQIGGTLPKVASLLNLPSRPLLRDPRDAEAPSSEGGGDREAGGGFVGSLLKKLGL